jgi:hypothetical protein
MAVIAAGGRVRGVTTANTRLDSARWTAFTPLPDGGALLTGSARDRHHRSVIVAARFGPDGSPDRSFGASGVTSAATPGTADDYAAAAIGPGGGDNGALIAADTQSGGIPQTALLRLRADGTLDAGFRRRPLPGRASGLAIDHRGRIVVAGSAWSNGRQRVAITRSKGLGPPSGG